MTIQQQTEKRISQLLLNMDLPKSDPKHKTLLREGVYMRLEFGYAYKRIERALEAKLDAMGIFGAFGV